MISPPFSAAVHYGMGQELENGLRIGEWGWIRASLPRRSSGSRLRGTQRNEAGKHPPAPRSTKRASEHQRLVFCLSDFDTGLAAIESGDPRRAAFLRFKRPLRRISL